MNEALIILVLLFGVCGFIGGMVFLRMQNIVLAVITALVSFAIPWVILRPLIGTDLVLSFVAWGIGVLIAYVVTRWLT